MGRGVFATADIKMGELIMEDHILLVPHDETTFALSRTIVNLYVFGFGTKGVAISLGHGSLINHDPSPSVEVHQQHDKDTIQFVANQDIKAGDEIFIDYMYTIEKAHGIYERTRASYKDGTAQAAMKGTETKYSRDDMIKALDLAEKDLKELNQRSL